MVELAADLRPNEASGLILVDLENQKQKYETDLKTYINQKQSLTKSITQLSGSVTDYETKIKESNIESITGTYNLYREKLQTKNELDTKLHHYKITIGTKLDKLKKLETHEYDPNCRYCTSNAFVQDAIKTKEELELDKKTVAEFLIKKGEVDNYIEANKLIEKEYKELQETLSAAELVRSTLKLEESKLTTMCMRIENLNKDIALVDGNIELYYKNIETIKFNTDIQQTINLTKRDLEASKLNHTKYGKQLQDIHGKIQVAQRVVEECNASILHMQELADKQIAYDYYLKAVGRDGIPYVLISKAIPFIQDYVNGILSQVVDFTVEIETDGKNINVFICYDGNKWPLELASGMERFMSALAIRIALIKITNLPKPDFIAIDEGLGVLDSSNLNSMHMFFNYLKDVFKFTLVISHIDVVRDMMDTMLTIDRKDDFSYINYM